MRPMGFPWAPQLLSAKGLEMPAAEALYLPSAQQPQVSSCFDWVALISAAGTDPGGAAILMQSSGWLHNQRWSRCPLLPA